MNYEFVQSHDVQLLLGGICIVDKRKYTSSCEVTIRSRSILRRYIQVCILLPNKDNTSFISCADIQIRNTSTYVVGKKHTN